MVVARVRLYATLRRFLPGLALGEAATVELPDGARVRDLLEHLQLPDDEVKMVFVNGVWQERDALLPKSCEVGIFPAVGGG